MIATAADTLHEFITLIAKRHAQNWAEASRYRGESDPSTVYRWESTQMRNYAMRMIVDAGVEAEIRNAITDTNWSTEAAVARLLGERNVFREYRQFTRDILEMGITSVKCGSVTL
jgi:hypothetical protein